MQSTVFLESGFTGLFVIGIIAAVIIAYGVQFILSIFSLATGLSLTPNLKEKAAQSNVNSMVKNDGYDREDDDDGDTAGPVVITSAIGMWVLLTACISLLVGSYIGTSIIPITQDYFMTAGLVIWALFFISLVILEYKTVSSIIGSVIKTAGMGLRQSASALSSALAPSTEKQIKSSVRAVYDEVDQIVRKENVDKRLQKYLDKVTPEAPSLKDLRKQLEKLIDNIEVKEKVVINDEDVDRILSLEIDKSPNISKDQANQLKESLKSAKDKADQQDRNTQKLASVIDHISPASDEDTKQYRNKLAEILNNTSDDELDADKFEQDIESLFDDPKAGREAIMARLKRFDRNTVKEIVSQLSSSDSQKTDGLVDKVFNKIDSLLNDNAKQHRSGFQKNADQGIVEKAVNSLFADTDATGLNYTAFKSDVQAIMEEPTSAPNIVRNRLAHFDRETVVQMLTSNTRLSRNQAENAADRFLEARDSATGTLDTIQNEASKRLSNSKRKAAIYAESSRKASITASWWLVASAILSAAASVLGVYMAAI